MVTVKTSKKYGKSSAKVQCYGCFPCLKRLQLDYIYLASKLGTYEQIVKLLKNNTGIRKAARALGLSINAVTQALKKLKSRTKTTLKLDHFRYHKLWCHVR